MHWATDGRHLNVIEWMINEGCKVDITDGHLLWTPLMRVAVLNGSTEVASLLIKAGANVNIQDKKGTTPLMVAVLNSHENLVHLLLKNGADSAVTNEVIGVINKKKETMFTIKKELKMVKEVTIANCFHHAGYKQS
ncbi:fibronectin type 3 and ankyrin repeat domains protein 1 [Rhincodon typus]|uniref:fibronectin type 3 and ankyrin repeat domains protein 1 n=1 Tax=Rhincodon typus TaxID=259920 RepID=UPI00202EDAE7|nr:fibronectin type 3 and ankyrin repeat domains protein 1 [Rhincodon typus]